MRVRQHLVGRGGRLRAQRTPRGRLSGGTDGRRRIEGIAEAGAQVGSVVPEVSESLHKEGDLVLEVGNRVGN
jgi:hypothetical protein